MPVSILSGKKEVDVTEISYIHSICLRGLKKMPRIFLSWDLNPHSFYTENILPYNQAKHNS